MSTHIPASLTRSRSLMKIDVNALASRKLEPGSFRKLALEMLGDLSEIIVLGDDVLCVTYVEPEKTAGGIWKPDATKAEARWQGKVNMVLKLGETAYAPVRYTDGSIVEHAGRIPAPGDFIVAHTSDTREIGIRGVSCRTIDYRLIRMIVPDPDQGDIFY